MKKQGFNEKHQRKLGFLFASTLEIEIASVSLASSTMGKKRERHQNPQPFLAEDKLPSKKQVKSRESRKQHQKEDSLLSSRLSSKILNEARLQEREVDDEALEAQHPNNSLLTVSQEPPKVDNDGGEEEDIDAFDGFSEAQSHFGDFDDRIDEEDEKLLEAFFSKDKIPQRTLADVIVSRIKNDDTNVSSEVRPLPKLDSKIIEVYKGVGKFLAKYTAGKMPIAFKFIPKSILEELLYLTEPENWSPNAMYQATRILASSLNFKQATIFYKLVLLPRIREDIRKNKRLHFALYQSLKKSLYKPAAFFKGILLPLCESRTCTLREAVVIGSIMSKVTIPMLQSSVALLKLAEMEYGGTTSYFIKLLLDKKYALPYRVIDALVAHFMRFLEEARVMPVIWHQSLLTFVQRYKNELQKMDKCNLRQLLEKQYHYLVTPEIRRELDCSLNRGEKEDDMLITAPVSVINKPIGEDLWDLPAVPMEDD